MTAGFATLGAAACSALLALAALEDIRARTIAHWIGVALALGFFVLAPLAGAGSATLAAHAAVGLGTLAGGFALFHAGWMGGGDGKLIAAGALWLGPAQTPAFLLATAVAGGLLAVVALARRAAGGGPVADLPYAVAIAAGGLSALAGSPWARGGFA